MTRIEKAIKELENHHHMLKMIKAKEYPDHIDMTGKFESGEKTFGVYDNGMIVERDRGAV